MPYHDRMARFGRERDIMMEMHCCGRTEDNIPIYKELGMNGWSAVQACNDTDAVKAEHGDWLTLIGGWDPLGRLLLPLESPEYPDGVTEEEIRQSVRDVIDRLAPGGRYVWSNGYLVATGDENGQKKNEILRDEAAQYGMDFYK
jgi:uroporphyrinogen-III decarboxylase